MKRRKLTAFCIACAILAGTSVTALTASASVSESAASLSAESTGSQTSGETLTWENFDYEIKSDDTAIIRKYNGTEESVTIPDEIDGRKVTEIDISAFDLNLTMTEVYIPETVTQMRLWWDDSESGYYNGDKGHLASPFWECYHLTAINVSENNPEFCSVDGVLFSKDKTVLIDYPIAKEDKSYRVPDGVKTICGLYYTNTLKGFEDYYSHGAFNANNDLEEVILPDSLEEIEASAFMNCLYLQKVDFSPNIKTIGQFAFASCGKITELSLPENLTEIGEYAFSYIKSVKSITIPEHVTSIGQAAFNSCTGLEEIFLPDSLTDIDKWAFWGCSSLKTITLPKSITKIKDLTFQDCTSLESIEIHEGITSIDKKAFSGCTALETISLPESVDSLGANAFAKCSGLKSIAIRNDNISFGKDVFTECDSLTIYGNKGSAAESYAEEKKIDFKPLSEYPYDEHDRKNGDADGDGSITVTDAVFILRSVAGLETLDDEMRTACDVNGDKKVDTADAVAILRYIAGYKDEGILIE